MASKRRNVFCKNKKQETVEISTCHFKDIEAIMDSAVPGGLQDNVEDLAWSNWVMYVEYLAEINSSTPFLFFIRLVFVCSHSEAAKMFARTITNPTLYPASNATSWANFVSTGCAINSAAYMGEGVSTSTGASANECKMELCSPWSIDSCSEFAGPYRFRRIAIFSGPVGAVTQDPNGTAEDGH
ncbi:hypothetical protein AAG570_003944 [Ranatra chinensis]|uniref:Uncharacterized protein n=1 Tax=Ranatra chinensis TaxID=642074 RepID=A0ABD0YP55_9HEMI